MELYCSCFIFVVQLYKLCNGYPTQLSGLCGPVNQCLRYANSCLEHAILIKMTANNRSQESVVLESSAKPSLSSQSGSQGLVWQTIQEALTQGCKLGQGCMG